MRHLFFGLVQTMKISKAYIQTMALCYSYTTGMSTLPEIYAQARGRILTVVADDTSKKNIDTNTESTQYFGIEYFF